MLGDPSQAHGAEPAPSLSGQPPEHAVILASAGTGKTFQLTNRFLQLLTRGVPPDRILATTFTRKAAGEILNRILLRLAQAAAYPDEAARLSSFLHATDLTQQHYRDIFRNVLQHLHRLRVGTLDSLFSQMASAFAWELRLPAGWKMGEPLEAERLRDQSLVDVLHRESTASIVRLLQLMERGDSAQSIQSGLRTMVDRLYTLYRQGTPAVWKTLPPQPQLSEDEIAAALDELRAYPLSEQRSMSEARDKDCQRFERGEWKEFSSIGLAAKILAGESRYRQKEIPEDLVRRYRTLLEHVRRAVRTEVAIQTAATYELLAKYDQSFRSLQQSTQVYRFDDVVYLLNSIAPENLDLSDSLRLDSVVDHLLLDEFQDTSLEQWKVLFPLAQRIVSSSSNAAGSFFCVGDLKQSIYGWRGGNSDILASLPQQLDVPVQELNESRRSAPTIMETVNTVFTRMTDHSDLEHYEDPIVSWCRRFPRHTTALQDLTGYAELRTGGLASGDESTLPAAAELIHQLCQTQPDRSIVVLVRNNAGVSAMADQLRRYGVSVSEEGGTTLLQAPGVPLLLSFFQWLDHPADSACYFHLVNSPLGSWLDLQQTALAGRRARDFRRKLLTDGYGKVTLELARHLAPHYTAQERLRLQQLVELAFSYQPLATLRPGHFLQYVATQRVNEPIQAAVRVMTIHQSKGLEFETVVLPQLHDSLVGREEPCVVGRDEPLGPVERITIHRSRDLQTFLPDKIQGDYAAQLERRTHESLCALYVALTRARRALYMIIPPSSEQEKRLPKTLAGLVRAALCGSRPAPPSSTLWQRGDAEGAHDALGLPEEDPRSQSPGSVSSAEPAKSPASVTPVSTRRKVVFRNPAQPTVSWVRPSELSTRVRMAARERLPFDQGDAQRLGSLLHAWFEKISWLDEPLPGPEVWHELARSAAVSRELVDRAQLRASEVLEATPVRQLLMPSFYTSPHDPALQQALQGATPLRLDLRREQRFAFRQADQLIHGTIDRVVILQGTQGAVAAEVIDFKSDNLEGDQHRQRCVDRYRPQMEAYRQAVQRLWGLASSQVTARLVFLTAGETVLVSPERVAPTSHATRPTQQLQFQFEDPAET